MSFIVTWKSSQEQDVIPSEWLAADLRDVELSHDVRLPAGIVSSVRCRCVRTAAQLRLHYDEAVSGPDWDHGVIIIRFKDGRPDADVEWEWADSRRSPEWGIGRLETDAVSVGDRLLWTDDELAVAIRYFREAVANEAAGRSFTAQSVVNAVAVALPARTGSSASRRLSNIAVALKDSGRPFTSKFGLSQTQVGQGVRSRILAIWDRDGTDVDLDETFEPTSDFSTLEQSTRSLRGRLTVPPAGSSSPTFSQTLSKVYQRDPKVSAWVLDRANGICESCEAEAPFRTDDGRSFLEVHHLVRLADGGADTVENTVAVCPNCHRALHFAADRGVRLEMLQNRA